MRDCVFDYRSSFGVFGEFLAVPRCVLASGQWRVASEGEDFAQMKRAKGNIILELVYVAAEAATHKTKQAANPKVHSGMKVSREKNPHPSRKGAQDGHPKIPRPT